MNFRYLFTSFEGRISRTEWWVGTVPLFVLAGVAHVLTSAIAEVAFQTATGWQGPVLLLGPHTLHSAAILAALAFAALFRPAYAVAAKRFQDRDKPGVTALYGLIPWTIASLLWLYALSIFQIWEGPNAFAWICAVVIWSVQLWFIIELGFLKGTAGPNRFDIGSSCAMTMHGATIGGRFFTYVVSAAGVAIMAAICNSVMHFMPLLALLPLIPLYTREPTLLFEVSVVLTAGGCALIGFLLATPFARLALRVFPVDPFGTRTIRRRLILGFCLLGGVITIAFFVLAFAGFFINYTRIQEIISQVELEVIMDRHLPEWQSHSEAALIAEERRNQAVVSFAWSSLILGILYICFVAHLRAAHDISRPFAVFLRRFSGFADRRLVVDLLKSMPRGVPLAFIASRTDQARNWDPFTWAFGGLRLLRPFKNLPIQIRTTDKEWMQTVEKLLRKAECVIIDLSDLSPSVEIERQLIDRFVSQDRVVALAREPVTAIQPSDRLLRSAVQYSPRFLNSVGLSLVKVFIVLLVWWRNMDIVWGWLSLCVIPFLIMPSISRAERRRIREAVQKAINR